jgi:amino acid transporter
MEANGTRADGGGSSERLKRGITPALLVFFILGDIVGAGIYALVGEVGAAVGGAIWTAFLAAFILAIFTAASYAELVTKYPRAGGSATYVNNAFRNPLVSFMVAFAVMASGITSACTLTIAFSGDYLNQFISVPIVAAALVFMLVVGLVNFYGISESVRINVALTSVEIFGLLLIVLIGVLVLLGGTGDPGRAFEFKEGSSLLPALLAGTVLAFYALIGFDDSVNVAEETQNPSRNYPRAIFIALFVAGIVYLLVTFTASMVVPTDQLAGSSGPLLEVVERSPLAIPTKLFAAIALLAVSNGALINMIMASRIVYGMSDQGVVPSVFSRVHRGRRTPWVAILFTVLIALVLLVVFGGRPLPWIPRQHHGGTPATRVHHGEHIGHGVARRPRRPRALPYPYRVPYPRHTGLGGAPDLHGHKRYLRFLPGGSVVGHRASPLRGELPGQA